MPMFYHGGFTTAAYESQQFPQPLQRVVVYSGPFPNKHPATNGPVEHPLGNLQTPLEITRLTTASKSWPVLSRPRPLDVHLNTMPRMPGIAYFPGFGTMGVELPSCIIIPGRTYRWTATRQRHARWNRRRRARLSPFGRSADCIIDTRVLRDRKHRSAWLGRCH